MMPLLNASRSPCMQLSGQVTVPGQDGGQYRESVEGGIRGQHQINAAARVTKPASTLALLKTALATCAMTVCCACPAVIR